MIDKETTIQWVKDAANPRFGDPICSEGFITLSATEIQKLITRAQNEAFERAARKVATYVGCKHIADKIRALKQD